jgi:putative PIN family toxin of toxin-antitoxin system
MRVFLDTNVIVSAVTTRGLCADVLRAVLAEHELITSARVLQEVVRILKVKFGVPDGVVAEYAELIQRDAIMAEFTDLPRLRLTDKNDVEIVAAAVAAQADVLVTGDREVQALKHVRKLRVVSPREFWEELAAADS